jgi:hypothetical protein
MEIVNVKFTSDKTVVCSKMGTPTLWCALGSKHWHQALVDLKSRGFRMFELFWLSVVQSSAQWDSRIRPTSQTQRTSHPFLGRWDEMISMGDPPSDARSMLQKSVQMLWIISCHGISQKRCYMSSTSDDQNLAWVGLGLRACRVSRFFCRVSLFCYMFRKLRLLWNQAFP